MVSRQSRQVAHTHSAANVEWKRSRLRWFGLASVLMLLLAGCGGNENESAGPAAAGGGSPSEPTTDGDSPTPEASERLAAGPDCSGETVTIALGSPTFVNLPMYVAMNGGFIEDLGMEYELLDVGGGGQMVATITGGSADVAQASFGSQILARNTDAPIVAIAPAQTRLTLFTVVKEGAMAEAGVTPDSPDEDKLAMLEGRHFGLTSFGGGSYAVTLQMLDMAGLDPESDVRMTALGDAGSTLAAFESGQSDTMVSASPYVDIAVRDFGGEFLFVFPEGDLPEVSDVLYQTLMTSEPVIEERGQVLECFLGAYNRALQLISDDPEQAKELARSSLEEVAEDDEFYSDIADRYFPASPESVVFSDVLIERAERAIASTESEDGEVTVSFEDVVNTELAEKAAAWSSKD